LHWKVHPPAWQLGVALATPVVQTFPHEPQSLTLLIVSTQAFEHMTGVFPLQVPTQVDEAQTGVVEPQACPHDPQFAGSLVLSTQAPLHST
jgi:hypothetical protein